MEFYNPLKNFKKNYTIPIFFKIVINEIDNRKERVTKKMHIFKRKRQKNNSNI